MHDYQLRPGDRIMMRVLDRARAVRSLSASPTSASRRSSRPRPRTRTPSSMPAIVARATHDPGVATLLVQTRGLADGHRQAHPRLAGTRASVSDIETNRALIASSLTSVELQGLTRIELGVRARADRRGHRSPALARPRRPPPHVCDRPCARRALAAARRIRLDGDRFVTAGGVAARRPSRQRGSRGCSSSS